MRLFLGLNGIGKKVWKSLSGIRHQDGMVAANVTQRSGTGKSSKNRSAIAVGTTAQEITWVDGDNIEELTFIASFTSASSITVAQYALVVLDAVDATILGTSTTIPASVAGNQNCYLIPLNTPITVQIGSPLSYDGTTYVGNVWVRSIDNTNTLDIWVGAN